MIPSPLAPAAFFDSLNRLEIVARPLIRTIELRDSLTGAHCRAVGELAGATAAELGLSEYERRIITLAGFLHDLGKIGIPDRILHNTDALQDRERSLVRLHAGSGEEIVAELGLVFPEAIEVARLVGAHHERMDGSGYPRGLVGAAIPRGARIISVADTWSAVTMRRSYDPPTSYEQALEILNRVSGTYLDPEAVEAFCKVIAR